MKRLFWAELLIASLLSLVSCGSVSKDAAAEIEATSIPLASYYVAYKDYDKALEVYDRALEQSFDDYKLIYNRIYVLTAAERFEEAMEICKKAVFDYPQVLAFRKALAGILIRAEMVNRKFELTAIPVGEKFYRSEVTYYYGENYAMAASVLETVLELDPYDNATRLYLMEMYTDLGNTESACRHALVLWDQQQRSKEVIKVLYNADPEKWGAVYNSVK